MVTAFDFLLNGERVRVAGHAPTTTLLQFLRATGRTGSKEGCAEGDCGACSVAIVETNARGERTYRAINSCLALLPMVAGRELTTVEGLRVGGDLHPVQAAMVKNYGSQCGYCTPGFVVSMFEGYYRADLDGPSKVHDQLAGNLCRCTGYRPIRDAMGEALTAKDPARPDLFQIALRRPAEAPAPLAYEAHGQRFLRPTSLAELLALRAAHEDAVLVAGATEIGVYLNKQHREFPFLITTDGVGELARIERTERSYRIGGGATLTALEEALLGEFPAIDKMLAVFASRQIRNRATLAGNLVTASPIGDMAPVLLALSAEVVLASAARGERTVPLADFFVGYRKTALAKDEIVSAVLLPRGSTTGAARRIADSFKVSKRRELDISIVAAGMVIDLDREGVVVHASLGFGGVAPTPMRARRTEAALLGKPWNEATVKVACGVLAEEFSPIDDLRSSRVFRSDLAPSLLEKLWRGERSLSADEPLVFEDSAPAAPASSCRALPHESAVGHVTGGAQYVGDQALSRPMLEIWPIMSRHAHAKITRRDATKARTMPGVVAVLMAEDIPGENDVGAIRKDETLFAAEEICFYNHLVGVVVGESIDACRRGADAVEIDATPLPAILGIEQAMAARSFHTEPHAIRRGDCASALAESPFTLAGELEIGGQEHFYLESQAAWAECGDDGDVRVVSSTQHPSEIQAVVAHVLHLPRNKVVVEAPRMGGGFGGKETQGNTWAAIVALAAMKTKKPVRLQLDRDVDMALTGKRHPFHARYEVGFGHDGRLRAARIELTSDGGWALDLSESICDRALFHLDNSYFIPAVHFTGRVAKTNTVSHTAFRGFGGPQGMVVIEEILDRIARRLDLLPEVVRERNLYAGRGATNTTHYGQELEDNRIPAIWRELAASSDLASRRRALQEHNAKSGRIKRGIAMTPVKFGISFTASFLNQAGALVVVYRDGSVQVNHGGTEMGQGLYTKILGVAMRELGLPAGKIRMMKTTTDKVPNTSPTAASSGSDLNGAAVKVACETLRARLVPVAVRLLFEKTGAACDEERIRFEGAQVFSSDAPNETIAWPTLVEQAYVARVSLAATGFYSTPGLAYDRTKGHGRPFHYFAYGAAVTEVEVDGWTGMKRVVRVDILHDVGDSLNPGIDRGQIEGGFVQGMGWLTGEELRWDAAGRLLTHSASTYPIPSIGDAPACFRVTLLPDAAQGNVIHGSKAVGEPPLMLAISVREAIRDAIAAFGRAGGEVALPSPATHEAIFAAVKQRLAAETKPAEAAAE